MDSAADTPKGVGCPIRKSPDQRSLPSPRSLSQGATSFIASRCQGIHQMPFSSLENLARIRHAQGQAHTPRPIRSCETPRMSPPPNPRPKRASRKRPGRAGEGSEHLRHHQGRAESNDAAPAPETRTSSRCPRPDAGPAGMTAEPRNPEGRRRTRARARPANPSASARTGP